eukprot:Tbor_TRINITY_DN5194_c1_g12::TRINITY_DN5194_c1_g12_i1::g.26195::m.26195
MGLAKRKKTNIKDIINESSQKAAANGQVKSSEDKMISHTSIDKDKEHQSTASEVVKSVSNTGVSVVSPSNASQSDVVYVALIRHFRFIKRTSCDKDDTKPIDEVPDICVTLNAKSDVVKRRPLEKDCYSSVIVAICDTTSTANWSLTQYYDKNARKFTNVSLGFYGKRVFVTAEVLEDSTDDDEGKCETIGVARGRVVAKVLRKGECSEDGNQSVSLEEADDKWDLITQCSDDEEEDEDDEISDNESDDSAK